MNRSGGLLIDNWEARWVDPYEKWREESIVIMRGRLWDQVDKPGPHWTILLNICDSLDDEITDMEMTILWYLSVPEKTKQRLLEHVKKIRKTCWEMLDIMRGPE